MQSRNAIFSASYQALHLLAIIRIVMLLPCTAYDLVILREYAVYPEYQIATLYQLVIILFDGRMFGSIFRLPVVEIVKYGFRRFRIRPVEKIVMQLCTGVKAGAGTMGRTYRKLPCLRKGEAYFHACGYSPRADSR